MFGLFKSKDAKLIDAVKKNNYINVLMLLQKGADINIKDKYGYRATELATKYNYDKLEDTLRFIKKGNTPLLCASKDGHISAIKVLIKNGADVNAKDEYEATALILASYKGHKDIAELLIKNGADVNVRDKYGDIPLILALKYGHKDIVELLIKNGADVNVKNSYGITPLISASYKGYKDIAELLIKNGADVNAKDEDGYTALVWASKKGHKDIAELLVKNGADVNAKDKDGDTALIWALKNGHKDIVELLIKNGADVNAKNNNAYIPLIWASKNGHRDIAELLIKNGADVNAKDKDGDTALIWALKNGHKDIVELLVKNGADVNAKNSNGDTALIWASAKGHRDIVELLIKNGADVNVKNIFGDTALIWALKNRHKDIAELLIKNGADVNAKDKDGNTPLILALRNGHRDIVELLVKNGAVNAKDKDGDTALIRALYNGHKDIAELLVKNGADVNAKNKDGDTALIWASSKGHKDIAELLIKNGTDVNAKSNNGNTALILASMYGHKDIVELLIKNGADVNVKNSYGNTALIFALDNGHRDIAELLIKNGADVNAKDKDGDTALIRALDKGHKDIAELLIKNGADVNSKAKDGVTALILALKKGHKDIAELLVKNGAVNAKDKDGDTALIWASAKGHRDIAELLVKNGADVNAKNKDGDTALIWALNNGHRDIVELLIKNGALIKEEFASIENYRNNKNNIILAYENDFIAKEYNITNNSLLLIKYDTFNNVNNLITSLALKMALKLPDSQCEFIIIDTFDMGKNCGLLLNLDMKLKKDIFTQRDDIDKALFMLEKYTSEIHTNYLKGFYKTLDEYNEKNPEIPQSKKIVIIYNYFKCANKEQQERFIKLFSDAKNIGINFILSSSKQDLDINIKDLNQEYSKLPFLVIDFDKFTYPYPCILNNENLTETILYLNKQISNFESQKVEYTKIKPKKLWLEDSSKLIEANIGKNGKDNIVLKINNELESHALLIGRSGSGKSNLLHILISDLILNYSPENLKLYLIDMKGGTEFIKYADPQIIPHLEIASITSDREMALTILRKLETKLNDREKLFSSKGVQNIEQFNKKFIDEKQERVLLVLDEFQELFVQEDNIKREATSIFDRISKKGRSFGINMILASQSLGGDTLPSNTVNQFAIRIVLKCSEDDSRRVLSFDNTEAKNLTKPGEGIYNSQNGSVQGNIKFQTYWLENQEHNDILEEVVSYSKNFEKEYNSTIFREDIVPTYIDNYINSTFNNSSKNIIFGQPYGLSDNVSLKLKKESSSNVLICGSSQELATNILSIFLLSLSMDKSTNKKFYILLSNSEETNLLKDYSEILKSNNIDLTFLTKKNMMDEFSKISQLIQDCIENDSKLEQEIYLFVDSIYKTRILRKTQNEYGGEKLSEETEKLSFILKNGSEFGAHSLIYIESMKQFDMIFDYNTLKQDFNNFIALQMSEDDSQRLVGNYEASKLGINNALLIIDDVNTQTKFRPFELPQLSWLEYKLNRL